MKNPIPDTPEERQITELAKLRRELEELKAAQPPTVSRASISLGSTAVAAGATLTLTATLSHNTSTASLLTAWDDTWYKDSVTSGNEYEVFEQTAGKAWNGLDKSQYQVEVFNSWGLNNNKNFKHITVYKNDSASSTNVLYRGQARVLVPDSSGS